MSKIYLLMSWMEVCDIPSKTISQSVGLKPRKHCGRDRGLQWACCWWISGRWHSRWITWEVSAAGSGAWPGYRVTETAMKREGFVGRAPC